MKRNNNYANEQGQSAVSANWRRAAVASALGVVVIAGGLTTAAPAFAGTCTDKTGGSSNTLIWTGTTYTCAYVASNGNNGISALAPDGWSSNTAMGYTMRADATKNSGGVKISKIYTNAANSGVGSSVSYTAYNSNDGSRHWTACVLWQTADRGSAASSQYTDNCEDNYNMPANLMHISKIALAGSASVTAGQPVSYTVTVTAPDGGGTPTGTVVLWQSTAAAKSQLKKNCDGSTASDSGTDKPIGQATLSNGSATVTTKFAPGSSYVYATYSGMPVSSTGMPSYCMAPPQRGLTPALQDNTLLVTAK